MFTSTATPPHTHTHTHTQMAERECCMYLVKVEELCLTDLGNVTVVACSHCEPPLESGRGGKEEQVGGGERGEMLTISVSPGLKIRLGLNT